MKVTTPPSVRSSARVYLEYVALLPAQDLGWLIKDLRKSRARWHLFLINNEEHMINRAAALKVALGVYNLTMG